jgi:mono/diheme cytochrome c family protein
MSSPVALRPEHEEMAMTFAFPFAALAAGTALGIALAGPVLAADGVAGQKLYDQICADCHELKDHAGKPAADLQKSLKAIVARQKKHKKQLRLDDEQIANVSEYLSTAK